ncbi:acyl-CoA dehydrogenase [Variovorax sp. 54]|uniref:acyl-CoA dehydrogenase family protein n=1 Tax=Variovorax sp. 54 TaxID=2035212 RepID=UPI000C19D358|nr:acyl-CoA dehydrogenase family protein [Variovorax sp. 54]PIF77701.1 acyl-CoA dehydrogenase [Variovorax sp. 54]
MSPHASTPDLEAFRAEVRHFLEEAIPADIRASVRAHCLVTREQASRWQRILHARGWGAPGWPREHGGPGWSLVQQAVFREELAASDAPRYENLGIDTIGPTLMRHGTPAQQARFLPRMLSFDDYWAQGYSEPDAGSDLASLRTTARREGDHYVVSGTKIWQSYGHWANWALVLVRSDSSAARKQDGISVLLIDLESPGVTVRPIRFMNGAQFHVQLFFDEVRVPVENLVGVEHAGWSVAKGLLVIERLFVARVAECKADVLETARMAEGRGPGGGSLLAQDVYARRFAELDVRARALDAAWWPAVRTVEAGGDAGLDASLLKLQGNALLQDLQQLQLEFAGLEALPCDAGAIDGVPNPEPLSPTYAENLALHVWRYRGITLGGGTSEVQRGIVAKAIFGGQSALDGDAGESLNDEQAMLDTALRRLLADRYAFEHRQRVLSDHGGFDASFWQSLHELGIGSLCVPERDGGFGGGVVELSAVMEATGEALLLEPLLWSTVLGVQLVSDTPPSEVRSRLLDGLADGLLRVAFAHGEGNGVADVARIDTLARRERNGWRLSGRKRFVLGGDGAQTLLVSARLEDGGLGLFTCDAAAAGVARRSYRLHDGRGACDAVFDDVALPIDALIAGPERASEIIEEAVAFATIALAAESVGAMRRALALTVDYMRTRKQFGRALSDYQALQHRVVEHYRLWGQARTLVREAAQGWLSVSPQERVRRVSAAKCAAGLAGRAIALDSLQLHGAIGLQDETAISHYAKRLTANDVLLGDATFHLGRFASAGAATP